MAEGQGGVCAARFPLLPHFGEFDLRQDSPPPLRGTPLINAGGKNAALSGDLSFMTCHRQGDVV